MELVTHIFPIALVAFALGGCGAPHPLKYYALELPAPPAASPSPYAIDLVVGRLASPSLLQGTPIVYRTSSNQMGTYQYERWEDSPVVLVQSKLIRMLRTSGRYQSVGAIGSLPGGDYLIRGNLYHFEEVDAEGISARVTMEFELYNRRSGKILWSRDYSQTAPVESKEVTAVVQALDQNLDRGLQEVLAGLNQYFAANPPKAEPTPADHQDEE